MPTDKWGVEYQSRDIFRLWPDMPIHPMHGRYMRVTRAQRFLTYAAHEIIARGEPWPLSPNFEILRMPSGQPILLGTAQAAPSASVAPKSAPNAVPAQPDYFACYATVDVRFRAIVAELAPRARMLTDYLPLAGTHAPRILVCMQHPLWPARTWYLTAQAADTEREFRIALEAWLLKCGKAAFA